MLHLNVEVPKLGSHLTAKGGRLRAKHAEEYERRARDAGEGLEEMKEPEEAPTAAEAIPAEHTSKPGQSGTDCVADAELAAELSRLEDAAGGRLADLFKMLGDTTRIKLLGKIAAGEMRVGDIAGVLGMQPSAISHQLRVLRAARVVTCRREGKEAWYSLDDDHVVKLMRLGLEHVQHG